MGTLLLVRHGQASYGQADYDRLSPLGEAQARAVGPALAGVDAIFVGPLRRQQQTAELARGSLTPVTLLELAEYPAFELLQQLVPRLAAEDPAFAELTTAPTPKLLDRAFQRILSAWARDEWRADGVETIADFVARVRAGLEHAIRAASAPGARIACITSAGCIGVAVGLALDAPYEAMVRTSIVIRNASISEFRFRRETPTLTLAAFNHTAHLPADLHTER
ncbi:MAG TPA: histidine phosphatase family protein [Kofleriaceae bacterium]|jgi:broad specificity phosphatase PhoE